MKNQNIPIFTILFVGINVLVFFNLSSEGSTENVYFMLEKGAMYVPYIYERGEYYRIITSMFMHYGFEHLFNNMIALLAMGIYLEPAIGKTKFALIYLLSGIGGTTLSLWYECQTGEYAVSAGASGAVFGLTGALLCVAFINSECVAGISKSRILLSIGISLYNGFTSPGINNAAHIGGMLSGFILAFLFCIQSHSKGSSEPQF